MFEKFENKLLKIQWIKKQTKVEIGKCINSKDNKIAYIKIYVRSKVVISENFTDFYVYLENKKEWKLMS